MTTYAETKGCAPFDWNKALENAITEEPTRGEQMKMHQEANDWVTCACGNQCDVLPRTFNGSPEDRTLYHYGIIFCREIACKKWGDAKETLALIEARTAELLSQLK